MNCVLFWEQCLIAEIMRQTKQSCSHQFFCHVSGNEIVDAFTQYKTQRFCFGVSPNITAMFFDLLVVRMSLCDIRSSSVCGRYFSTLKQRRTMIAQSSVAEAISGNHTELIDDTRNEIKLLR